MEMSESQQKGVLVREHAGSLREDCTERKRTAVWSIGKYDGDW